MKIFINPGHDLLYDSGAVNSTYPDETEAIFASKIGNAVSQYLQAAGFETEVMQSDNLYYDSTHSDRNYPVCVASADFGADLFISIHCNSAQTNLARGTECYIYNAGGRAEKLASCIQNQIVSALGTIDRGVKEMPSLIVLKHTAMPAVLVETAFINNDSDFELLHTRWDDFARAIARGVTDYIS